MNKRDLKYYLIPVGYFSTVLAMDLFSNFISIGLFVLILGLSFIGSMSLLINRKRRTMRLRLTLAILTLIPFIDLSFGMSNKLRDELKGQIVFNAIDKSFATTRVLIVRQKGTELIGEYESSVAGIGDSETADIWLSGDTITFKLTDRKYEEVLVFDRNKKMMKSKNSNFKILVNQIFE